MKNFPPFFLILALLLPFVACNTSGEATGVPRNNNNSYAIENPDVTLSLVDHLRKVPGVTVIGNGPDASVSIRGRTSMQNSDEPLYVVDGNVITGGLRDAISVVPVQDIKSIRVLKTGPETSLYGVRGANGVIKITLKKGEEKNR